MMDSVRDPAPPQKTSLIRVLLIEDDAVDRKSCIRALRRFTDCDYVIQEADSGDAAFALLGLETFDCALLDMRLPDTTGLEFLDQAEDLQSRIPFIMMTGMDDLVTAVEAMKRGARDYIVKDSERRYLDMLPAAITRAVREQSLLDAVENWSRPAPPSSRPPPTSSVTKSGYASWRSRICAKKKSLPRSRWPQSVMPSSPWIQRLAYATSTRRPKPC